MAYEGLNFSVNVAKTIKAIDKIMHRRHGVIHESWPAYINEPGVLGFSSGLAVWSGLSWYKVWFDTESGSTVLHNKIRKKKEAQEKYLALKREYGYTK